MIVTLLLPYLKSTSNVALSCRDLARWLRANGFPIRTSNGELSLTTFLFYKSLYYPDLYYWMNSQVFREIKNDKPENLRLLLQGGANTKEKTSMGYTALTFAIKDGRTNCLKILLQGGADIEAVDGLDWTPLICAVLHSDTECLEILLENKADLETINNYGDTALLYAVRGDEVDCLKTLLKRGAKVSPQTRANYPQYAELWGDSTL